jgi:hypothetical protein
MSVVCTYCSAKVDEISTVGASDIDTDLPIVSDRSFHELLIATLRFKMKDVEANKISSST